MYLKAQKSSNPFIKSAFNKIETGCQFFLHQTWTRARSHKQRRVKMCQKRRIFKRLGQDTHFKTHVFCFSILIFSFTLSLHLLLLLHCVETIFILRVPQSQHNWCRNARSESINPFYPSVTPVHCIAHLSLSSLHTTGLFCTLYTAYKLQLITVSCELKVF